MALAFFDLDLTVLAVNSGTLWVRRELSCGHISYRQALRAFGWLGAYHLGFARIESVLLESIASLAGQPEKDLADRTRAFFEAEVRSLVRPGARAAVARHREAGDGLWMLTTSSNYLSEAFARDLGLDGSLCNRFEVDGSGLYTGRPLGPLCFGPGKVQVARALADERGVPLAGCTFYTDSASDLPMLEAVGHPVAVNPDPRLRRIAAKRSWPIVDWGTP